MPNTYKMVLTYIKHLVSEHPSTPLLIEAIPVGYTAANLVHVEKRNVFLEIDSNKYSIYVEPRARSLLLFVEHCHKNVSVDYHRFSREVVHWKNDSDYEWVRNVKRISSIWVLNSTSSTWMPLEPDCTVCLKAEEQCYTPCGHVVCKICLGEWHRRRHSTCPVCRTRLSVAFMTTGDLK